MEPTFAARGDISGIGRCCSAPWLFVPVPSVQVALAANATGSRGLAASAPAHRPPARAGGIAEQEGKVTPNNL